MPRRLSCSILVLLALTGACRPRSAEVMSREKFVRVNVALRLLPDSAPNLAARRDSILRREHVTAAQLQAFVRDGRAATLAEAWRDIAARLDSAAPKPKPVTRPRGSQVGVPLPPPTTGGPQDSVTRPGRVRPTPDTIIRPGRLRPTPDTVAGRGVRPVPDTLIRPRRVLVRPPAGDSA
jgi:hypothetical protein